MTTPAERRLIRENEKLSKEIAEITTRLRWARVSNSKETELKNACFFFLVGKGLYTEFTEWHSRFMADQILDELKKTF